MKKNIINTSTIRNAKAVSKPRKATEHSPEFIAKQNQKLKDDLIIQLKTDDPRVFVAMNEVKVIEIPRETGEEYKLIPGTTKYYVSNHGHALKLVYDKFTDVYLEHSLPLIKSINKTGRAYSDINIRLEDGTKIKCRLSRAIVKTFLDDTFPLLFNTDDKRIVDHINNNSENDNLSNLRICSSSENIRYALYEQGKKLGWNYKTCYAYNVNTEEVRMYKSTGELCRDIWNNSNKGYFHASYTGKNTTKNGWQVGYDLEEIKSRSRKEEV